MQAQILAHLGQIKATVADHYDSPAEVSGDDEESMHDNGNAPASGTNRPKTARRTGFKSKYFVDPDLVLVYFNSRPRGKWHLGKFVMQTCSEDEDPDGVLWTGRAVFACHKFKVSKKSPELRYDPDAPTTKRQDVARFTKITEIECSKCTKWSEGDGSAEVQAAISLDSDSDSDVVMDPERDVLNVT